MSPIPRPLLVLGVAAALALAAAGPASASPKPTLQCGQTVTHSVKLNADLTDCPGNGLVIGANDVTVDLNGHTIEGVPLRSGCDFPEDERSGVANHGGYDRMVVEDGTIQQFDTAVAIGAGTAGTSDSRVHHLVVRDARFAGLDIGSGAGARGDGTRPRRPQRHLGVTCGAGLKLNTARPTASTTTASGRGRGRRDLLRRAQRWQRPRGQPHRAHPHVGVLWFQSGAGRLAGNSLSDIGDDRAGHRIGFVRHRRGRQLGEPRVRSPPSRSRVPRLRHPGRPRSTASVSWATPTHATADGVILEDTEGDLVRGNTVIAAGTSVRRTRSASAWACSASATPSSAPTPSSRAGQAPRADITAPDPVGDPAAPADAAPTSGNLIAGNAVIGQDGDGIHVTAIAQGHDPAPQPTNRNTPTASTPRAPRRRCATTGRPQRRVRHRGRPGVTDAGGNRAHGNGNPAQCSGVVCG